MQIYKIKPSIFFTFDILHKKGLNMPRGSNSTKYIKPANTDELFFLTEI